MIRGNLCFLMDDDPCDGQLRVLPSGLAERRDQSLERRHRVSTWTGAALVLVPVQLDLRTELTCSWWEELTWSWSMSVSPDITILFSILVSDMAPFNIWGGGSFILAFHHE